MHTFRSLSVTTRSGAPILRLSTYDSILRSTLQNIKARYAFSSINICKTLPLQRRAFKCKVIKTFNYYKLLVLPSNVKLGLKRHISLKHKRPIGRFHNNDNKRKIIFKIFRGGHENRKQGLITKARPFYHPIRTNQ